MKTLLRFGLVVVSLLLVSSCEAVQDDGSPPATGSFTISSVDSDLNEPGWIDNQTLVATTGFDDRVILLDTRGNISREITVDTGNETIRRLNLVSVSPDRERVAFHVEYDGDSDGLPREIATTTLADGTTTVVSDQPGPYHGTSFADNSTVYFFYYAAADTVHTMELRKTAIPAGTDETVFSETAAAEGGEATEQVYWFPRGNDDGSRILLCTELNNGESDDNSYIVIDESGELIKDLSTFLELEQSDGGDFISDNELVVSGRKNGASNLFRVNIETEEVTALLSDLPSELVRIFGVQVSPDGTKAAAHVWCEDDATGFEGNRLMVVHL